ncbi:DUF5955 family protein [Streptomyces smaragdinus]|uniref:DUF5955 family protein n=1 Tax=Streptomyces smaragdinus TaxID=2585196 RepID=UPI002B20808F|nr:DUF5955 family protein [Streptomyces smaragdinus]
MAGAVDVDQVSTSPIEDPRVEALATAVCRLRRELAGYQACLSDRSVAEDALGELAAMAHTGSPEVPRLRRALLAVAGALGSVSALAVPVSRLREVIDLFGAEPSQPRD